jgi:iron(III) transport system ATP-binding protein
MSMTPIRIQGVCKRFGSAAALTDISLEVAAGELFFLLGPSGCGKTTLLRTLAGFVQPDAGAIFFADKPVTNLPPWARDSAMVFQAYALWPHMTVAQNVAYGLRVRGVGRAEINRRVEQALKMVRMDGYADRRPTQLSGGQQQRVALARALVIEPRVLLLDEPLSNLDARLRDELREEIRRLHQETGLTMVYVTHDQKEALALADRLAVMDGGRLVQVGSPLDVYHRPLTRFVAGFLGDSNFLPGVVRRVDEKECVVDTAAATLVGVSGLNRPAPGSEVVCSVRPHAVSIDAAGTGPNRIRANVEQLAFLGEFLHVKLLAVGNTRLEMVALPHTAPGMRTGQTVTLTVLPEQVVVLTE